jgi:hypothetical protein
MDAAPEDAKWVDEGVNTEEGKATILSTPGSTLLPDLEGYTPAQFDPRYGDEGFQTYHGPDASVLLNKGSEPNLPPKIIVEENGIQIKHYTRSGDHGPAHLHITGGGREVKIGQNGKPIKGESELSSKQREVVNNNLKEVRKAVKQMQKWHKYVNGQGGENK